MPAPTRVLRASWSSTLNLPKSSFPPRPVVTDRPRYLKRCTDDLYHWQRNAPELAGKKPFVLHDGPPYANGSLHIGHALNKILKDIILRVQLAQGRPIEYVPGWDCHGLPIELKALQQHREKSGKPLQEADEREQDVVEIRGLARSLALRTVEEQRDSFRQWAIIGDWDHPYKTLDKDFELRQLEVFRQMLSKGLIYRRFKPVYWSPSTRTALAEAELEYKDDHISHSAYVAFEVCKENEVAVGFGLDWDVSSKISLLIWTTTPWTLPANKVIAVHDDLDYVCALYEGLGYLIVAKDRLDEIEKVCGISRAGPVYGPVKGAALVGVPYKNDAFAPDQFGRVLTADFVSADSGTGLVHCAPGHGMEDYLRCLDAGIEPFAPVDDSGCFTNDAFTHTDNPAGAMIIGQPVTGQGNRAIVMYLKDSDNNNHGVKLVALQKYKHKYPYDWRSKQPVVVRATAQWFADVGEIRDAALKEINNVTFIPSSGKDRLVSFVNNRSEWCISRQRAWGVPIPALYRKDNGEALLTPESVAHVIAVIQQRGIDAWWTDPAGDQAWVPAENRGVAYERGRDTMDVWFDSGTSWTHMGRKPGGFDARSSDVYLEGSDQHRGWFQSSILTKIAYDIAQGNHPTSPFTTLITHGFTLDGQGKKMSKSIGNTISPDEIMNGTLLPPLKRKGKKSAKSEQTPTYDALGPDALRLWVASSDYTKDINVGEAVLKGVNGDLNKLRVTFKLLTGLLEDYSPSTYRRRLAQLEPVDIAALLDLSALSRKVWPALTSHEHHKAVLSINQYINAQFSAFYMEAIKDRMYTEAKDGPRRRDAQFVLWHIFEELCSILRPIVPLLVEEARSHLRATEHMGSILAPMRTFNEQDLKDTKSLMLEFNDSGDSDQHVRLINETLPSLMRLRSEAQSMLEEQRSLKKLGSSLQSYVVLEPLPGNSYENAAALLKKIASVWGQSPHLEDLFVVSAVDIDLKSSLAKQRLSGAQNPSPSWHKSSDVAEYAVRLIVHEHIDHKCERCWKYNVPDASDSICPRCETVVGRNEQREKS